MTSTSTPSNSNKNRPMEDDPSENWEELQRRRSSRAMKDGHDSTSNDDNGHAKNLTRMSTDSFLDKLDKIDPHVKQIVWRDFFFLLIGLVASSIIGFVETNAADADARIVVQIAGMVFGTQWKGVNKNPSGIVDTGYLVTQPIYEWLRDNRDWNDVLAGINSFFMIIPTVYITYVTAWKGDYSLIFRLLAVQLLRSVCGWYTYLPPDPTYLPSHYDFPDFIQCLTGADCNEDGPPEALPFVSFFSGHVATMVICGNHLWLHNQHQWAVVVHILNVFQIVRLLATRGHYSIDMIIGWYVAVYVSNPAGRLGRYYSKGVRTADILPQTPAQAFEYVTGVADTKTEKRISELMQRKDVQELLANIHAEEERLKASGDGNQQTRRQSMSDTDTTARILQQNAANIMNERLLMMQEQAAYLQENMNEHATVLREKMELRALDLQVKIKELQDTITARATTTVGSLNGETCETNDNTTTADADHAKKE